MQTYRKIVKYLYSTRVYIVILGSKLQACISRDIDTRLLPVRVFDSRALVSTLTLLNLIIESVQNPKLSLSYLNRNKLPLQSISCVKFTNSWCMNHLSLSRRMQV
jgi:hypothetical protein